MDFFLSSKSLKQIKESGIEEDFQIKIFDESIECNTFVALFISEQISKQYRIDPTMRQFKIQFPSKSVFYSSENELKSMIQRTNFVDEFKHLLNGSPICIESKNNSKVDSNESSEKAKLLLEFGKVLQNEEMIEFSLKILGYSNQPTEIASKSSIQMLRILRQLGYPKATEKVYETIASNFYSIFSNSNKDSQNKSDNDEEFDPLKELKEMSKTDLSQILSSSELKIESEDWLFELITSLGSEFYFLYDYVEIQYLSVENVSRLIENIENFNLSLHSLLWSSICRRLTIDVSKVNKAKNPRETKIPIIECDDGIFKYFEEKNGNNFYQTDVIGIETSTVDAGEIKNLFDHSKSTDFRVKDQNNSFIIFDFKDKKVNVSKYYFSVSASNLGHGNGRLKTWLVEGSNDKSNWETIDKQEDDKTFTDYETSKTFAIEKNENNFYRFIRIKEIIDQYNSHYLMLSEIELYGSIIIN